MYTPLILKRSSGLLLCLLFAFSAHSQTVFWGVGSTNGVAEAEFQNPFVQAGSAIYSPTAWTAVSISDDDGNTVPGAAYWVRSTTGVSQGAYATTMSPVLSPSQNNGVALFDSDFLDNAGTRLPAGAGMGTSPSDHRGELVSPRIDLTAARDSALLVEFFCQYRPFQVTEWSVSMSTDDGLSWSTPTDVNTLLSGVTNSTSSGTVRWVLPNVTQTGGALDQCRIKFTFEGQYYYYILDDISIKSAPEYDLAIGEADIDGSSYFTIGNLIRMSGNTYRPWVNIDVNNPVGWAWGAKVINKGYKDIGRAQNPRLICRVDQTPDNGGTTTSGIYYDTIYLDVTDPDNDTIFGNDRNGVAMVKEITDLSFIDNLNNPIGRYDVSYWVEHDNMDGATDNDTIEHFFVITNHTSFNGITNRVGGTYLSKARLSGADGRTTRGGSIFPGGAPFSAFEYGSLYYFPAGGTNQVQIDSVDFRYYLRNAFSGAPTQTVFIHLYEFVDGSNGGAANGLISGDELTQIGLGPVTLTGLGTTRAAGDYHLGTCTNLRDAVGGTSIPVLRDGMFYYVSLRIEPSLAGGVATFGANDVPTHAVDRLNYAMNIGNRTTTVPFSPSTMQTVDASGSSSWFAGFTGFDEVPSIGLFLSHTPKFVSTRALPRSEEVALSLFPNPTSDLLNIKWGHANGINADVQYIITDAAGRVVYLQRVENVSQDLHQVDVSNLVPGIYFVSAQSDKGVTTQRFIKK